MSHGFTTAAFPEPDAHLRSDYRPDADPWPATPALEIDELLTVAAAPRPWARSAACAGLDPELFFPQRGEPADVAIAVCAACPVRQECLDHALEHGEHHGIWGGTSAKERRRMQRSAA
jgi:WhiB family transcriptional regulator, redox-sensing transcriptional regulator